MKCLVIEFLTSVLKIPVERLAVTVFGGNEYIDFDKESYNKWLSLGIKESRIAKTSDDNFWIAGEAGPCGPDTEIFYWRSDDEIPDTFDTEDDRWVEIWNNVFMAYNKSVDGVITDLPKKNVDTGMGVERVTAILEGVDDNYLSSIWRDVISLIENISGLSYNGNEKSMRVIADHIRTAVFIAADPAGIKPSNTDQGYILRRLIRRAIRHAKKLDIDINSNWEEQIASLILDKYSKYYQELVTNKDVVYEVLKNEKVKFNKTLASGLREFEKVIKKTDKIDGTTAFHLYDTYGFPIDLTIEILEEKGFSVDEDGFKKAMENQRQTARDARETTNYMGKDVTIYQSIDASVESKFVGYDRLTHESKITVLTTQDAIVDELKEGEEGTILVEETPMYATMGGQVADAGVIEGTDGTFVVEDVIKLQGTKIGHVGRVTKGVIKKGETVKLTVDEEQRNLTANNHSATHLMQQALREVLGSHVEQKGSLVDKDKLRFDFTHFSPMTEEEIAKVEEIVNREIAAGLAVVTNEMSIEDAKKTGAMALFGEKYGEVVRVVQMGTFSSELCGGTHVSNTRNISAFKIISESGVAAGVRRIEALTGKALFEYYNTMESELQKAAKLLKAVPLEVSAKIVSLQDEVKQLQKENDKLKAKLAKEAAGDLLSEAKEVDGIYILTKQLTDVDMNGMRDLGDEAKQKLGEAFIVFASQVGEKVNLIAMATDGAIKKGAHAGNLIKEVASIVGGGGGGRPNMAQAGGKLPEKIPEALACAKTVMEKQIIK